MTKAESINLYRALNNLGHLPGVKFAYAITRNIDILKPEIQALEKALEVPEYYKEFEEARIKLAEEHSKKDEAGKPLSANNEYQIEDVEAFEAGLEALKEAHREAFDKRQKEVEEYNELLKQDSTVVLYQVKLDHIPEAITAAQMYSIKEIIED